MLTALTSLVSGGLTGILGAGVQRFADYKNKQLDLQAAREKAEHDIKLREADAAIMREEWAARTRVAEIEVAGKESAADAEAFAASFRLEPQRYSEGVKARGWQASALVLLDVLRGVVRPGLTIYLCAITTAIYFDARSILGDTPVDQAKALALLDGIIATILYLTTTVVLWWFGTRNKSAAPKIG